MMRKLILATLIILLGLNSCSRNNVHFELDMKELITSGLFNPIDDKLVVRGNFNNWAGNEYELSKTGNDLNYSGVFKLNLNFGDTVEYKFIILRNNGSEVWESNPDPQNKNNGNRIFIFSQENFLTAENFVYDEYIKFPVVFSKEKLLEEFDQIRKILESTHPALYDYTSKNDLDSLFNLAENKIDRDLSFREFYNLVSPVIAKIGCGHTHLWIPGDYWRAAPDRFFPLKLVVTSNGVLVKSHLDSAKIIPIGSEIRSINGVQIERIIEDMKNITSSDGLNEAGKIAQVEKNFSKKYALIFGFPENFSVEFIEPGNSTVEEIKIDPTWLLQVNNSNIPGDNLEFKFFNKDGTGLLTINTFGYYDQHEMFKGFIDSVFLEIKTKSIDNLIIDLRGNNGGDPVCAAYLLSYLEKEPVQYFEKPYGSMKYLSEPIEQAKNSFKGNLMTLIDGRVFSTTGHLTALLKFHKIGRLVGSETGATYTCTGSATYPQLKHTRMFLGTARHRRYSVVVEGMDSRRGVIPDILVEPTQKGIIENRDEVLETAMALL